MLGDDDVWGRYHLEEAALQLSKAPEAVGYFGQAVVVRDDSRQVFSGYARLCQDCHEDHDSAKGRCWTWRVEDVFLESLLRTPLNMWSMVAQRDAVVRAMDVFDDPECGIDSDRMFIWRLCQYGDILVGREVSLFYRTHVNSTGTKELSQKPRLYWGKSYDHTMLILQEAQKLGVPTHKLWFEFWEKMTVSRKIDLCEKALPAALAAVTNTFGSSAVEPFPSQNRYIRLLKALLSDLIPPIALRSVKKILSR